MPSVLPFAGGSGVFEAIAIFIRLFQGDRPSVVRVGGVCAGVARGGLMTCYVASHFAGADVQISVSAVTATPTSAQRDTFWLISYLEVDVLL